MNTYKQQLELVKQGLAKEHKNNNLSTFKYSKKVMYDYLWDKHPELLECRGHVYDSQTEELVQLPPKKSFNYLENGTWRGKDTNEEVTLYKKYNGFMLAVTKYKGEVIFSTTGTTNSDFVSMGAELFYENNNCSIPPPLRGVTDIYEVIHKEDPHIVEEEFGLYRLGARTHWDGIFTPCGRCKIMTIRDALEYVKTVKHEGFMMYDSKGNVCKLKSPYYSQKKKLMRMTKSKIEQMYWNTEKFSQDFDDSFKFAISQITSYHGMQTWTDMKDQDRRQFIELCIG